MEKDQKEKPTTNWWQTVPGILTAIATLMTATGGLMLALNQVGCFDKNVNKNETAQNHVEKNIQPETLSEKSKKLSSENSGITNSELSKRNYPLILAKIPDTKMGDNNIKFIQTTLDNHSTGKLSLTFKFRFTNNTSGFIALENYYFRLLYDDQIISPEKPAAGYVDAVSSKDSEVTFLIPDSLSSCDLQLMYNYDKSQTTKVPITLISK